MYLHDIDHMTNMAATPIYVRLRNNLDLQYSLASINSISCLHAQTFSQQAAILSEKSTVFTFSN